MRFWHVDATVTKNAPVKTQDFPASSIATSLGSSVSADKVWACMSIDGVEVMFALPKPASAFLRTDDDRPAYFKSDEVEALGVRLRDQCKVVYPLEDFALGH